jgi:hypothetical protein
VSPAVALKRAAGTSPSALRPADILSLQRTVGNRAVGRILRGQPGAPPAPPSTPANALQRKTDEDEPPRGRFGTGERKENRTGLPDGLKAGIENLSGMSMDDVKVHYNSPAPAGVQALAYTQGTDIHLGPGQEEHLPHEAWHVVQQKQGRVKPTLQMKGVAINDDARLEKEADVMGDRVKNLPAHEIVQPPAGVHQFMVVMQRQLDPATADATKVQAVLEDKKFAKNHTHDHVWSKGARKKYTSTFKTRQVQVASALHLIKNHAAFAASDKNHAVNGAIPPVTAYVYAPPMPAWMVKKKVAKAKMYVETDAAKKIVGIITCYPDAEL